MIWTAEQFQHRLRWARQMLSRPNVAIIGGYHNGNLGDMALAQAASRELKALNAGGPWKFGVQTIYELNRWPRPERVIIGGGAVLNDQLVRGALNHVGGRPEHVAILAADILENNFSEHVIAQISQMPYVSLRSNEEASRFREYGAKEATAMPDLAFAFHLLPSGPKSEAAGINVVPDIAGVSAVRSMDAVAQGYRQFIRASVGRLLDEGREVAHIPFTRQDDEAARAIIQDRRVQFHPYRHDPLHVYRTVAACSRFVPTRFHSLVFCLCGGVAVLPFLYARKSELLMREFFPAIKPVSSNDLRRQGNAASELALSTDFYLADPAFVRGLALKVRKEVRNLSAELLTSEH